MEGRAHIVSRDEAEQADFQRPDCDVPSDPRGGFSHDPEFEIQGQFDGGTTFNSKTGNYRNPFSTH